MTIQDYKKIIKRQRSQGNRDARRNLRLKGKPHYKKGHKDNRGKIPISHELSELVGFNHKSGLLTLLDRHSRFLIAMKLTRLGSKEVKAAMIKTLADQPLYSITPDYGREFQLNGNAALTR